MLEHVLSAPTQPRAAKITCGSKASGDKLERAKGCWGGGRGLAPITEAPARPGRGTRSRTLGTASDSRAGQQRGCREGTRLPPRQADFRRQGLQPAVCQGAGRAAAVRPQAGRYARAMLGRALLPACPRAAGRAGRGGAGQQCGHCRRAGSLVGGQWLHGAGSVAPAGAKVQRCSEAPLAPCPARPSGPSCCPTPGTSPCCGGTLAQRQACVQYSGVNPLATTAV